MSLRSPKNKFCGTINFDKPLIGLGSSVSYTADSIEQLKKDCENQAGKHPCHIVIKENMKPYPEFDWKTIETYNLNKD